MSYDDPCWRGRGYGCDISDTLHDLAHSLRGRVTNDPKEYSKTTKWILELVDHMLAVVRMIDSMPDDMWTPGLRRSHLFEYQRPIMRAYNIIVGFSSLLRNVDATLTDPYGPEEEEK